MKPWVLHGAGDIRFEETEMPSLKENEVMVRVKAAGVCGSDIPRVFRTGAHTHPLIPGHEFSGIVESVGRNVQGVWLGQPVGVYPLLPCGICYECQMGHPEMCRKYGYLGSRQDGGFAEYVSVPVTNLIELPDGVSFEDGAMLEPHSVAVHAVRRVLGLLNRKHDKICICGLGPIGLMVTMILVELEFADNLYLIGNRKQQAVRAEKLGIKHDHIHDKGSSSADGWLREMAGEPTLYIDCSGNSESILFGIDHLAPGGRLIMVGNNEADLTIDKSAYSLILRKQLVIYGSWNSTFLMTADDDWHYVLEKISDNKIDPGVLITHRTALENLGS